METHEPWTVDLLRQELKSGEGVFRRTFVEPALVGRAARLMQPKDAKVEHVTRVTDTAMSIAPAMAGLAVGGQVFFIKKRPGGQFPELIGVGRTRTVDISLPFSKVSKYHAYFSGTLDSGYALTDANSANGTFVDGQRLAAKQTVTLHDRARIRFADYEFQLCYPDTLVKFLSKGLKAD